MPRDTGNVVRTRLQVIANAIDASLPDGALFTLLVWTGDSIEGQGAHYVSNADRDDVIASMRETADRLEGRPGAPSEN